MRYTMLMAKTTRTTQKRPTVKKTTTKQSVALREQTDSAYILKLVLYVILGATWLQFAIPLQIGSFTLTAFPIGLIVGFIFAAHDYFQVDRKIEYAILIMMTVLTYFVPAGIIL